MIAAVLLKPAAVATQPLQLCEWPKPVPARRQIRIRVKACGMCRTDLHVVEGELPPRKTPLIPGHQVVGVVESCGGDCVRFREGDRVGVAWLHATCGDCVYCRSGRENLCESAWFTGYTVDGGFAQYLTASEDFVYRLPDGFGDHQAAPLLCAGIIGYRCLRISGLISGQRLGFYGFGAAAHIAIQVARHAGADCYVCTRDPRHRLLSLELGAIWSGAADEQPPVPLDAAIIFAPAGELVPAALKAVRKGGVVTLGGIHMSEVPAMPYQLLYGERVLRSVANNTRQDGEDLLRVAAEIPLKPRTVVFPLSEINQALNALKNDAIQGAAVIEVPQ